MLEPKISHDQKIQYCEEGIDRDLFSSVYRRLRKVDHTPQFNIRYFSYKNIKNTLRIRGNIIYIRISDLLREAPPSVMASIYEILICRTFRLFGYHQANLIYNHYISSRDFLLRKTLVSPGISRIKKHSRPGKVVDLGKRFTYLNNLYFKGELSDLTLYWAERKSKRILGQFVPHRREILINSTLDHPLVPESVVDFVLYHEMLHARLDPKISKTGRKTVHHREFKRMERQFEGYNFANEFIKENF